MLILCIPFYSTVFRYFDTFYNLYTVMNTLYFNYQIFVGAEGSDFLCGCQDFTRGDFYVAWVGFGVIFFRGNNFSSGWRGGR